MPALAAVALSKVAALPVLALYLVLVPGTPTLASIGWGALGGLFGGAALVVFYRALSAGAMAIVAPVSAVTAALVPLVIGLVIEAVPGPLALIGAGCAIVAIGLVSLTPHSEAPVTGAAADHADTAENATEKPLAAARKLVLFALLAGTGFGLFFV